MARRTKGPEAKPRTVLTVWIPGELHAWLRTRKYSGIETIEEMVTEALQDYRVKIEGEKRRGVAKARRK